MLQARARGHGEQDQPVARETQLVDDGARIRGQTGGQS